MFYNRANGTKKIAGQMGVFAGTERQCTEDQHDDEDEHDSQISEFGINITGKHPAAVAESCESRRPEGRASGCS